MEIGLLRRALAGVGLSMTLLAPSPLAAADARPHKVGVTQLSLEDTARKRPLPVRLWYPAAAAAVEQPQAYARAFKGSAAPDAAFGAGPAPLVVLSHGDRGNNTNQSWLAEALAANGTIVAAVDHWKNTTDDFIPEATIQVWERPQDLSFVVSALLADATWKGRIDPARIGAAGHSSGGYSALALAGAVYSPFRLREYCQGPQAGPDCALGKGLAYETIDFKPSMKSYRDARIRAVFAMAPAVGPSIEPASLQGIAIPVHIVAAANDELVPFEQHAARYARGIPDARLTTLAGGGHFVFMPECNLVATVFTWFHRYDICGRRHDEVVRTDVHAQVARAAVEFFGASLAAR